MASDIVTVQVDSKTGVALITLNNPPVNSVSSDLILGLQKSVDDCFKNASVKAIVLTGANGKFSGGADISAFGKKPPHEFLEYIKSANSILNSIENGPKPVVAAISTFALGGGLEIAMACHARVCSEKCSLGLPELTLGLIPGFGGTQRLPRLVGVAKSLDMMLTSRPINAQEAKKLGLANDVVPVANLVPRAAEIALELAKNGSASFRKSLTVTEKFEDAQALKKIFAAARQQATKNKHIYHMIACVNAIEAGVTTDGYKGLDREAEEFMKCAKHPATQALVHVFFASKATTKVPGVTDGNLKPRKIKKAAVLGGGTMGSGIVTALILSGIPCILKEINQGFLDAGINRVKDNLQRRVQAKRMSKEQYEKTLSLLIPQLTYDNFNTVDIVIEAAIEDINLKQKIFVELEQACSPTCILASNTSTIDLEVIAAKTKAIERVVGTHFFSPAHVMPLLEIIRTNKTNKQVLLDVIELSKVIGKTPIIVGNCIGFTVNRMFYPYSQAALFLAERGVDPYRIDRALEEFGMPVGVFKMMDLSGVDVSSFVGNIIINAYKDRVYRSSVLAGMVEAKRLGQKNGLGFYKYEQRNAIPDRQGLEPIIAAARKTAGNPESVQVLDNEIVEMCLYSVANEALRTLSEGHAIRSSDIDIGSIYGYGFPSYRGGVLKWIETEGHRKVFVKLNHW